MQEGLEGNPVAGTMKNISRGLAILTVPFTMNFPKVILHHLVALDIIFYKLRFVHFQYEHECGNR
jgi:YidC/Oxa1 family membrane protein insertase